eukprot:COSAG05_NODE_373_length_10684_cov_22.075012_7_plen_287_part_00
MLRDLWLAVLKEEKQRAELLSMFPDLATQPSSPINSTAAGADGGHGALQPNTPLANAYWHRLHMPTLSPLYVCVCVCVCVYVCVCVCPSLSPPDPPSVCLSLSLGSILSEIAPATTMTRVHCVLRLCACVCAPDVLGCCTTAMATGTAGQGGAAEHAGGTAGAMADPLGLGFAPSTPGGAGGGGRGGGEDWQAVLAGLASDIQQDGRVVSGATTGEHGDTTAQATAEASAGGGGGVVGGLFGKAKGGGGGGGLSGILMGGVKGATSAARNLQAEVTRHTHARAPRL